jgi:hypothetical protein
MGVGSFFRCGSAFVGTTALPSKSDRIEGLVIGGYTEPEGSRKYFGALLVGFLRRREPQIRRSGRDRL